ncbi:MAG: hypothetical protein A2Y76_00275 [Planctomycetes bacterium RBG_13_60_9]|nr:MAG: hypothetical protein A2Y76_00275 [Planctomycetes bacterium RBG_13_60_9]
MRDYGPEVAGLISRVEDSESCLYAGAACSRAVVRHYNPLVRLLRDQGLKLASGFGGGMRLAQTSGAGVG